MSKINLHRFRWVSISAIIFVALIIGFSILFYYIPPEEIISSIGIANGYLVIILGGFFAGLSLFFPFPNYLVVFTFASGGLNPLLLGLFAAFGVAVGECTSYLFGYASHSFFHGKPHRLLDKFSRWLHNQNPWVVSIFLFLIGSVPLPNDLVLVPLGLTRYSFGRVIIPLSLGNLLYNTLIAMAGYYSFF